MDGVVHSDSLINMTCLCTEGMVWNVYYFVTNIVYYSYTQFLSAYGGDSCTEDRNGCSEIECFEGVECFDVPAPGVGAVCGSCPSGYTGDGLKCFGMNSIMVFATAMNIVNAAIQILMNAQ